MEWLKLHINGSIVEVPKSVKTISELIAHFDLSSPVIIVEHNDVILQNGEHENAKVNDGHKVEFVQFVGGG